MVSSVPGIGEHVHATLYDYTSDHGRCLHCDQRVEGGRLHKTCCSDDCWTAVAAIGALLTSQLSNGQEGDTSAVDRLDSKATEEVLHIMGMVMTRCPNSQIRRKIRKVFQNIGMSTGLQVIPRYLHLNPGEFKVDPGLYSWGGFANVYKGTYRQEVVAVKIIRCKESDQKLRNRFLYEALIWQSVKHKRLMPLLGILDQPPVLGMISPFCKANHAVGFLETMVQYHERFRWTRFYRIFVSRWLLQIAEGLDHLHSEGIVHGDLHPWNILVSDTRSKGPDSLDIDIIITDFGLSIYHEDNSGENGSARGGRPSFNAPELCDMSITGSTRPTTISDSFSWAASAYNLFTTKVPYADKYYMDGPVRSAILRCEMPSRPVGVEISGAIYNVSIPDELWRIVAECWQHPDTRPTIQDIISRLKPMQRSLQAA